MNWCSTLYHRSNKEANIVIVIVYILLVAHFRDTAVYLSIYLRTVVAKIVKIAIHRHRCYFTAQTTGKIDTVRSK
jgi:hypothetical protein